MIGFSFPIPNKSLKPREQDDGDKER
uniref:Uncharacterized protein n=1 Tax=Rhizophora mucronata TaxID=61149 RepID=A0A2P2R4R5_RHIMU